MYARPARLSLRAASPHEGSAPPPSRVARRSRPATLAPPTAKVIFNTILQQSDHILIY